VVAVLGVHNRKTRIFGSLHPEPLLKLATTKGFTSWLVKTGCRYESDLGAFSFAFPTMLKLLTKEHRHGGHRVRDGLESFVNILKKLYLADKEDATIHLGVNKLLESWLNSKPTASDARAVLQQTQAFLTEGEQASLWKLENMRAMPVTGVRKASGADLMRGSSTLRLGGGGGVGGGSSSSQSSILEMEELQALPPKTVAATLTLMRLTQFTLLSSIEIVKFCTLTPDPMAFELYPRVAEYVDFGNILGRWTKLFVLSGGSKQVRGDRLKWLYQVVCELEHLRNYDLCFHMSAFATWELMPDIAHQSKVDIDSMLEVLRKFGDRKFWNGGYQKALQQKESMIPLLVYHSNLISGGFGGSDSIIEKRWGENRVSYINVSKFRSIGEQMQLLQAVASWSQPYDTQLKSVGRDSDLYVYFEHVSAPSDASLTIRRSEIIPVSKHRESGKLTSFDQFSSDVVAAVSAQERRVVKWYSLVRQLESDEEVVKMRDIPVLLCPRDAILEGNLLPGMIKALIQTCADIEWASSEYWLLRRILGAVVTKSNLEDIIMSAATLWERAYDSLPKVADHLCSVFVSYVTDGGDSMEVIKAARELQKAAVKMVPELDGKVASSEAKLKELKTQGGALSRARVLVTIGKSDGKEKQAAELRMQEQTSDMEESLKLTKAKLEHYGAQRALMVACEAASRDFGVLLDLWRTQEKSQTELSASQRKVAFSNDAASFFLVKHDGERWKSGAGQSFIYREPAGIGLKEFQDRLLASYETVFGQSNVIVLSGSKQMQPALKPDIAYMTISSVRLEKESEGDFQKRKGKSSSSSSSSGLVFLEEVPYVREGSSDSWKKSIRYLTEPVCTKKRLNIADTQASIISPIESSINDIKGRTATVKKECSKQKPDSSTAVVLQSVVSTSNTGILKACAYLVDKQKAGESGTADLIAKLSLEMWDFLCSVREGLAFFSMSVSEEDLRIHHLLCKSFRELLALVLPSLGPPVAENFHYASLYQFVSLLLPAGFAKPLVDSPMVIRRQSRAIPINRNARAASSAASLSVPMTSPRMSGSASPRISSLASPRVSGSSSPRASSSSPRSSAASPRAKKKHHTHRSDRSSNSAPTAEQESLDGLPSSPFFEKQKKK
jgi:hypothetical protein